MLEGGQCDTRGVMRVITRPGTQGTTPCVTLGIRHSAVLVGTNIELSATNVGMPAM